MRIGIQVGAAGRAENAIDGLVESVKDAAAAGVDAWLAQLSDIDALTALAAVAREVDGVRLGTAVVPTYPRHPMVMAMQALTVQAASKGRFTLGIGLSHQVVIEGMYGIAYDKPIRHMREYLEILMPLLHTGACSFEGQELTARTMGPLRVAGAEPPGVLVAAMGTQMLELAGRLTDGTVLWMVGPKTIADHIAPTINKAAEAAGRAAPRVVVGLPVSVTADPEGAREKAGASFGLYDNLPAYRAMLDKEGAGGPADVAIVGDEDQVANQLRRLEYIGATELSLTVFGTREDRSRTMNVLSQLATE
jgi:F420-dependent oxidoreductase-like protein